MGPKYDTELTHANDRDRIFEPKSTFSPRQVAQIPVALEFSFTKKSNNNLCLAEL